MGMEKKILWIPPELILNFGYIAVFFFAFAEGLPIIGTIFPGQIVVILAGFFAHHGFLNLCILILIVSLAAILGDIAGYLLGKKYGPKFLMKCPVIGISEEKYDSLRKYVLKNPGKALIIGRFIGVTRAFAPFIAGACKLNFGKFLFYNVIGGTIWATISLLIGYFFAESFEYVFGMGDKLFALSILIAIVFIFILIYKSAGFEDWVLKYLPNGRKYLRRRKERKK